MIELRRRGWGSRFFEGRFLFIAMCLYIDISSPPAVGQLVSDLGHEDAVEALSDLRHLHGRRRRGEPIVSRAPPGPLLRGLRFQQLQVVGRDVCSMRFEDSCLDFCIVTDRSTHSHPLRDRTTTKLCGQ